MATDKSLRLVRLDIRAIKRISAVSIRPDGTMTQIKGRNAQGKSTVLDSVQMALCGARSIPADPVRHGEADGEIVADFGEFVARRTITDEGKGALVVTNKDGTPISSPQTFLDGLIGKGLAFDPCAFSRMEPKQQAEVLRRISGLDLTDLDARHARAYADRTNLNRDAESARARLSRLAPPAAGLPEKPIGAADAMNLVTEAMQTKQANDEKRATLATWRRELEAAVRVVDGINASILELQRQLKKAEEERDAIADDIQANKGTVAALVDPDVAALKAQVARLEEINAAVRSRDAYVAAVAEANQAGRRAAEADRAVKAIAEEREAKIAAAAMPVPGLGFDDSGVTYNGVPFAQASSAEQLRVSMAIALKMSDRIRLCLIRNGNDLDSDGLRIIEEMAEQADAQVLIERVSDGDAEDGAVVIEDGMVKAHQEAATV